MTAQLRDMEENGLVNRKVYAEVPPRVEYSLTELGQSLKPILDAMWSWAYIFLSVYIEFVFSKMQTTPRIGFWLDNSNQTPQQTAENILNARKPV